eukprot:TRINITY_DN17104_c0_g1_i1.p1 TRINITY_DN17104_c0_g1~~TRINITY_DN17104_c0_g1_i1.p1  ORF type:complete len:1912 (-),score=397.98 TRINITY_DN17104_c0_g1_i1:147-5882(-)
MEADSGGDLSPGAAFLLSAVLRPQPTAESARRYFPMLRKWAEIGKEHRGRTYSKEDVEEAIAAYEKFLASGPPATSQASSSSSSSSAGAQKAQVSSSPDDYWPRWAIDSTRGVDVLAPSSRPGKPPAWTSATPVAIGYRGQKKKFLFVRTQHFEMDCRRNEVRPAGGGRTAQERFDELVARGETPVGHPEWTNGSDMPEPSRATTQFITPGVAPKGYKTEEKQKATGAGASLLEALDDDFERMALLQRSNVIKTKTCDHPDPLSEPRAAAGIQLPELTERDTLALPSSVAESKVSSLQLETIAFAARRFRTSLPDGRTAGYMLGDGTGCGKGRVIAALVYHMWNCGARRSIWVSATSDLFYDACRDLQDLGADIPCMPMRKLPPSGSLDKKGSEANKELVKGLGIEGDGVIFLTYSLLVQTGMRREIYAVPVRTQEARDKLLHQHIDDKLKCIKGTQWISGADKVFLRAGDRVAGIKNLRELQSMKVPFTLTFERVLAKNKGDAKGEGKGDDKQTVAQPANSTELNSTNSRLGQLVEWLGAGNATGLICFDEVHKAKNLVPDKDDKASTKTGLFVDLLQQHCPKAPVLYVSATAATEVQHLGYMSRLGAWGPGTAFENFGDFMKTIQSNGVGAMEMFAINMKAIGAMSCRALAYVGTEFDTQQTGMTQEQIDVYNKAARFWQKVWKIFQQFIHDKELKEIYRAHFFKKLIEKEKEKAKEGKGPKKVKDGDDDELDSLEKRLRQFYWGAQQRFFKAMCNSAKVPTCVVAAQEAVNRGEQVVISIWATGEARSRAKMERMKEETAGRCVIDTVSDGGLSELTVKEQATLKKVAASLYSNMRLKNNLSLGGKSVVSSSRLVEAAGQRIAHPDDLEKLKAPCKLIFRSPTSRRLAVKALTAITKEPVHFELNDDALGERVIVSKVLEGPDSFRRAELEGWHIKNLNDKPVGKLQLAQARSRLRKGVTLSFQDPVIPDHLSGPQMILEHFLRSCLLTKRPDGEEISKWKELKDELMNESASMNLPANAMDEILDKLGGYRKVAEMSGRSHRIKRHKNGSLSYVARCEELRCQTDGVNLVEQVLFQKGTKKVCMVTEVASAGISLHADRRQLRDGFQPPRRKMICLELPWGADKQIQVFGRVHRANQLVAPRFLVLTSPLGGEVRFTSAIARRMKLLGAVTKGDRMTSMGGVADRHMTDFDVNNMYGKRALLTLYRDTTKPEGNLPELLALYESLPFIGAEGAGEAAGHWLTWEDFVPVADNAWTVTSLHEEIRDIVHEVNDPGPRFAATQECMAINRFFNRILMLEVHIQNAMFEAFFSIYSELVRVDKANGVYDEGIENLNSVQGRKVSKIEVEASEVFYKDPASGAETRYTCLKLDRGISWEVARSAFHEMQQKKGSAEGFYAHRRSPEDAPSFVLVKEMIQLGGAGSSGTTMISRRRRKQFCVWRADLGVRGGLSDGKRAFSEEYFQTENFERCGNSEEDLKVVEEGWTKLYEETAARRWCKEHILTGDVLMAWRLVNAGNSKKPNSEDNEGMDDDEQDLSKLQIVRAVVQPDNQPVVGMRLKEEDVPSMKYVLQCQQACAEELHSADKEKTKLGLRDATFMAADLLLKRLWAQPDNTLPVKSWVEVHKMLADEGIPRSVDGLRAAQWAVERLLKCKALTADGSSMKLAPFSGGRLVERESDLSKPVEAPPTGEALEVLIFPEEFVEELRSDSEASDADPWDAGEVDEEDQDEAPAEQDDAVRAKVAAVATPVKKSHKSDDTPDKDQPEKENKKENKRSRKDKERKPKKEAAPRASARDKQKRRRKGAAAEPEQSPAEKGVALPADDSSEDDDGMFDKLFGEENEKDSEAKPELGVEAEEEAPAPESRKRQRDVDMAKALFGDFGEDSDNEEDAASPEGAEPSSDAKRSRSEA